MVTSNNYVQIQGFMVSDLKLKGNSLLVYALIYGFSQDGQSKFYGSRKYISEWFNISEPTVDKALQELTSKGLIIKEVETINNVNFNRYKINLEVLKNFEGGSKETLGGGTKETLHNNNNIYNNLNNNIYKKKQYNNESQIRYFNPNQKEFEDLDRFYAT